MKVVVEEHFITSGDATMHLALLASSNEVSGVLIHERPIESTLPYFCLSAKYTKVASIWCGVALLNDLEPFSCGDVSSE
jgi:hypothetical protein